jgi:hypothetical protein
MEGNDMTGALQADAIYSAGMKLLKENLGLIEAEIFISYLKRDRCDYTEWSQNLYSDMTLDELVTAAANFEMDNPHLIPKNARIV